jgi:hypothetical protein
MFRSFFSWLNPMTVALLMVTPSLAQKVHTTGYLPHWVMDNGYMNGAFEDQTPLLDEVTYFGEFRFRPDGTIVVGNNGAGGTGGTSILNMPNANDPSTWSLNLSDSRISRMANAYNKVASVSPSTRTTFTIGGWENSTNFHVFIDGTGAGSKAAFAAQQVRKILDLSNAKLSGVDLDWEDGCSVANCPPMETNASSYGNLTAAIRNILLPGETQTSFIQDFRYNAGAAIIGNIDSLRLATYDAPHADPAGHHTSVTTATTIANRWISRGYDKSKLSLGSGFYGRTLTDPFGESSRTFAELDNAHKNDTGEWLADSDTVYLDQGYDGPDSIAAKIDFIREEGLKEIFAWKLKDDNLSTNLDNQGRSHYLVLTQAMHDAAAFVEPIPGDFDGSGVVDGEDIAQWQDDFGVNPNSDADGDSDSDGNDYLIWQQNFNPAGGLNATATAVPEPMSAILMFFGLAGNYLLAQTIRSTSSK